MQERRTLLIGEGNMAFTLYMWQVGLDVVFPDMRALIATQKGYTPTALGAVNEGSAFLNSSYV